MENETQAETPMGRVWGVVLGTMAVVGLLSLLWHTVTMAELRTQNEREEARVAANIQKLSLYLSDSGISTGSTSPLK